MGFDPRQWSSSSSTRDDRNRQNHAERVTSNVEALLRENDALRREVQRLHQQLDRLRRQHWQRPQHDDNPDWNRQQPSALVSSEQVQRWGDSLAMQPGWSVLRQHGLELLIDQLNRSSFHSQLSLSQRLDRVVSGLGTDLLAAVGSKPTKKTAAVLASFALYGVRASEWLDEDPRRVVEELRQRHRQRQDHQRAGGSHGRRTRSDQRATDREPTGQAQRGSDDARSAALSILGLQTNASQEEIKQAFRMLVKQHHPDLGGSADAFHRVNDAYQLLMA
ncbi:DnaJ type IV chaperone protein [Synechococcus sp. BIOS-E4-1]|uniref:J domain-containing protein n=1 Tax=Synechococcus sp. BIOS-E4-1 TaxID=1400864 RepID=UPI001646FE17|nr:J domain-containing protein [Synechococcus sp. BIOS-E4-1]QNI53835.1 DnaJ type IV chaperone protein [Synechococcus sp. BIOS-E4-1]